MSINKENIEEFMFDYFEGNLGEAQKLELMDFLHKNPELEADFSSWAQSYALTGEKELDYSLSQKLLQTNKSSWFNRYKITITGVFIISIAAILFLFLFKTEQAELKHKVNHYSQSKLPAIKKTTEHPQPAIPEKNTSLTKSKKQLSITLPKPKEEIKIEEFPIVEKENSREIYNKIDSTISQNASGSIPKEETPIKASDKKETQESQKKKIKRKIDFKPSSEFLEINPNF